MISCRSALPFGSLFLLHLLPAVGSPPPGYYDSAQGLSGEPLRTSLHEIIDDHQRFPYTSTATDTWDILSMADEDSGNPSNVLTIYRNASRPKDDHTTAGWHREHSWPNSYGFPDDGTCNYAYTDCHALFAVDPSYNSSRSNLPYDWCSSGCTEKTVEDFPTSSNWRAGSGNTGSWEVWDGKRGDAARALFYMDVRYEGGVHGTTMCAEPDLILTDERLLIVSDSVNNQGVAYMGVLSTLIAWHLQDPVDQRERDRNEVIFGFQGNRNPFVDHPEWVCEIWTSPLCPTMTPMPCCPGDADNSGSFVDANDFIAVQANFGADQPVGGLGDADCSGGFVDALDFIAVQSSFGTDCE